VVISTIVYLTIAVIEYDLYRSRSSAFHYCYEQIEFTFIDVDYSKRYLTRMIIFITMRKKCAFSIRY
jgi:hypothetical protein